MNKFSTVIYTLAFASVGGVLVATKGFTTMDSLMAQIFTVAAATLGVASIVSLVTDLNALRKEHTDHEFDRQLEEIWRVIGANSDRIEAQLHEVESRTNRRIDQEVDAVDNRLEGLSNDLNDRISEEVRALSDHYESILAAHEREQNAMSQHMNGIEVSNR
jgi:hypothetical protein